jgi:monovalent cation:H+ antiporter-2, CPA2 family
MLAPSITLLAQQPAPAPSEAGLVQALLVILIAAAVVGMVFGRLRLTTIPGYLIVGALVGPSALGLVRDPDSVQAISNLAIVLLMFGVGLSIDLASARSGFFRIITIGIVSTIVAATVGWPIAILFGLKPGAAAGVALALTMSSTAVSLRILQARRELTHIQGRLCVGVSLVQDLMSVGILALLPALAMWDLGAEARAAGSGDSWLIAFLRLLASGALVLGAVLLGRLALPRLMREAAHGTAEVMLVLAAAMALAAAALTTRLGFSPALGAFLAGFLLSSTPFRYQIAGQLAPMRDLFMAVFFTALGLTVNLADTASGWWIVLLALVALFVVKGGIIALTTWSVGATATLGLVAGLLLAQAGEFALIVFEAMSQEGLLSPTARSRAISVAAISLMITPMVYNHGLKLRPWLGRARLAPWIRVAAMRDAEPAPVPAEQPEAPEAAPPALRRRVIIAGFGVVGRTIADHFLRQGLPFTIIELNPSTVRRQGQIGRSIVYGDVTNPEVLESAGIADAEAVILTIPDDDAMLRALQVIRQLRPDIFIAARTTFLSRAIIASEIGADHVTVEEMATAEAMERQVLDLLAKRFGRKRVQAEDAGPDL